MDKIAPIDEKFVPVDPDPDFNPDHNKLVVESTIKAYEKKRASIKKKSDSGIKERTEAVTRYIKNLDKNGESDIKKYFGRKELARLRGESIKEQILKKQIGLTGALPDDLTNAKKK